MQTTIDRPMDGLVSTVTWGIADRVGNTLQTGLSSLLNRGSGTVRCRS